jgi:flagellar basal-body rod protein FlgB
MSCKRKRRQSLAACDEPATRLCRCTRPMHAAASQKHSQIAGTAFAGIDTSALNLSRHRQKIDEHLKDSPREGARMNLLNQALGVHEQALQVKSRRLEVLAQNIANADTPNYKARDIDFKAVLSTAQSQDTAMASTAPGHFDQGHSLNADGMRYRTPFNTAFDGNTVEMSVEQAQYGKAAADYQATLSFLESRVSSVRKALRGD